MRPGDTNLQSEGYVMGQKRIKEGEWKWMWQAYYNGQISHINYPFTMCYLFMLSVDGRCPSHWYNRATPRLWNVAMTPPNQRLLSKCHLSCSFQIGCVVLCTACTLTTAYFDFFAKKKKKNNTTDELWNVRNELSRYKKTPFSINLLTICTTIRAMQLRCYFKHIPLVRTWRQWQWWYLVSRKHQWGNKTHNLDTCHVSVCISHGHFLKVILGILLSPNKEDSWVFTVKTDTRPTHAHKKIRCHVLIVYN